jgi:hypothetical protein
MSSFRMAVLISLMLLPAARGEWAASLNPLFDKQSVVVEPALAGDWQSPLGMLRVRPSGNGYEVFLEEEPAFKVHLVRLAGPLFLDVTDLTPGMFSIPVHAIARVRIENDVVRLAFLRGDWLEKKAAEEPWLSHASGLITAPTSDLQYFIGKHALDPDAFEDEVVLHRIRNGKD